MPGPMAAWARSTGAMPPLRRVSTASGRVRRSSRMRLRRSVMGASSGRGRSTRTMEEARALVPEATMRFPSSERMGQVAVMLQPERIMPSRIVDQPVDVRPSTLVSDCLKA